MEGKKAMEGKQMRFVFCKVKQCSSYDCETAIHYLMCMSLSVRRGEERKG
jgi:hypothetical protein